MRIKKLFLIILLCTLVVVTVIPGIALTVGYVDNLSVASQTVGADVSYSYFGDKVTVWDYGYSEYKINGDYAIVSGSETHKEGDYLTFVFNFDVYSIQGYDGEYKEVPIYSKKQIYEILVTSQEPFDHVLIYTNYSQYYLEIEDMKNGDNANTACGYVYIDTYDYITETLVYINDVYYANSSIIKNSDYDEGDLFGGIIAINVGIVFLIAAIINTVQFKSKNSLYNKKLELTAQGVEIKHKKAKEILVIWQEFKSARNRNEVLNIVENSKLNFKVKYITCEYCGVENDITKNTCEKCGGKLRRL